MLPLCRLPALALCGLFLFPLVTAAAEPKTEPDATLNMLQTDQLVAWCIVPFDAKKRGPEERAEMVKGLGLKRVAYDWRQEHVPTFEQEILAYKKHGLEFFAFWSWHPSLEALVEKHGIKPQIWITLPSPQGDTQQARVEAAAKQMQPLVEQTRKLGLKLGLYNHGGWGGEPQNMVEVCQWLRTQAKADHVGIVYNFHHAHDHIADFSEAFSAVQPYLLCLNINGMNDRAQPKILPLGQGQHEQRLLQIVVNSEYRGPVGILDHRADTDAAQSLRENLAGLEQLRKNLTPAKVQP